MAMIGYHRINNDYDIAPPGGNTNDLYHSIIVIIVTAKDCGLQPLYTYVERVDGKDTAIRQCPDH